MRRYAVEPNSIDAILVTHFHGDHFGGIPFFILDAQFGGRTRRLTVAGPEGVERRVVALMEELFPGSSKTRQRFGLEFVELRHREPERITVAGLPVTAHPAHHSPGAQALSLRVEIDGRVVGYSGDTAWSDELIAVADGADLFICEAYSFEKEIPYHLSHLTLEARIHDLRCRRLILTHAGPEMLSRSTTLERANDGTTIVL
jgi:ribonuclease BN (tRNA processing enzyme)